MKQRVFIGCSTESLTIAKAIQIELNHSLYTTIWYQDIFKLSNSALDDLINAANKFDFAIFIFSPDDVTKLRGQEFQTVRDNVIFELGLFIGRFNNRKRVFILKPRNVSNLHLPTDLSGVSLGDYDSDRIDELQASVGPFCTQVDIQIKEFKKDGMLSLEGKWSERWWVESKEITDIFKEPEYHEDNDVLMEQFGNNVSAKFKFNGRTYIFEGIIEQMRFITGSWRDIEGGPTYSGSFQLFINVNGQTLYGRWVGFSASSNSIKTGIWEWKKHGVESYPSDHNRNMSQKEWVAISCH